MSYLLWGACILSKKGQIGYDLSSKQDMIFLKEWECFMDLVDVWAEIMLPTFASYSLLRTQLHAIPLWLYLFALGIGWTFFYSLLIYQNFIFEVEGH